MHSYGIHPIQKAQVSMTFLNNSCIYRELKFILYFGILTCPNSLTVLDYIFLTTSPLQGTSGYFLPTIVACSLRAVLVVSCLYFSLSLFHAAL